MFTFRKVLKTLEFKDHNTRLRVVLKQRQLEFSGRSTIRAINTVNTVHTNRKRLHWSSALLCIGVIHQIIRNIKCFYVFTVKTNYLAPIDKDVGSRTVLTSYFIWSNVLCGFEVI